MILPRGCLIFQQYTKNIHHKYGIKFYELCTHDGLVLSAEIYDGQGLNDVNNLGQTAAIAPKLMEPYLQKRCHIFTDNYYSSGSLTEFLSSKRTSITDTLRNDSKRNPKKVISTNLKKGQMVWKSREIWPVQSGEIRETSQWYPMLIFQRSQLLRIEEATKNKNLTWWRITTIQCPA